MSIARDLVERPLVSGDLPPPRPTVRSKRGAAPKYARSVTVNRAESPLSWLKARGLLTDRQFDAGEALRADYERASLGPRVTMSWDAPPTSRTPRGGPVAQDLTHTQLSAKARFDAAVAQVGPGLADILWRIVCAGETVPVAEKALDWPVRSGRLVLGLALDRLADYYRLG